MLSDSPRDNVIWEHGFFTGGLGRGRVFVVKPRGVDLKVPSDWGGVGTAMKITSEFSTPSAVVWVKLNRPAATFFRTSSSNPGS